MSSEERWEDLLLVVTLDLIQPSRDIEGEDRSFAKSARDRDRAAEASCQTHGDSPVLRSAERWRSRLSN